MKKLTEEMVIARTKSSDFSKIKSLNCWGSEISDVSLLRQMPSVEVLSLSVNKINSLREFAQCKALKELYIRQNDIRDLNQVCYLKELPQLRNLWLAENPCASSDGYRLAVLRALPQLQKFDNVQVVPEEVAEASRRGRLLVHPEDANNEEEDYDVEEEYERSAEEAYYVPSPRTSPVRRTPPPQRQMELDDSAEYLVETEEIREYSPPPPARQSPVRRAPEPRRSYSPEEEPQQAYYENRAYDRDQQQQQQPQARPQYQYEEVSNGDRYQQPLRQHVEVEPEPQTRPREKNNYNPNMGPPFNRRPATRNSNILSAVLCLVKELDYPSLEVVEITVRCRMDELED